MTIQMNVFSSCLMEMYGAGTHLNLIFVENEGKYQYLICLGHILEVCISHECVKIMYFERNLR